MSEPEVVIIPVADPLGHQPGPCPSLGSRQLLPLPHLYLSPAGDPSVGHRQLASSVQPAVTVAASGAGQPCQGPPLSLACQKYLLPSAVQAGVDTEATPPPGIPGGSRGPRGGQMHVNSSRGRQMVAASGGAEAWGPRQAHCARRVKDPLAGPSVLICRKPPGHSSAACGPPSCVSTP